ncbi:hypothetical protein MRX96_059425 [Rhipicephalus microplus]
MGDGFGGHVIALTRWSGSSFYPEASQQGRPGQDEDLDTEDKTVNTTPSPKLKLLPAACSSPRSHLDVVGCDWTTCAVYVTKNSGIARPADQKRDSVAMQKPSDPKVTMLISLFMDHDTLTEPAVATLLCTVAGSKTSPGFSDCLAKTRDTLHSLTLRSAGFYSAPDCKMIVFQELDVVPSSRLCRGT